MADFHDTAERTLPSLTRRNRHRNVEIIAIALIVIGAAYRIGLSIALPVGYDEVFVMGVGLDEAKATPAALLIEVPLTRSSAITPLWWLVQYLPASFAGTLSLFCLRVMPALLGIVTLVLAWRLSRATFGRPVGLVFLGCVALSDILTFTNSRGEFSESLTVPLIIICLCIVGKPKLVLLRSSVWMALLMTGLGKGIFVVGLMSIAELVLLAIDRRTALERLRSLTLSFALAIIPVLVYLFWANSHFASAGLIHHEATDASNVGQLAAKLIFDYQSVKEHVVGSVRDAALIYLDSAIWPTTCIMALPLVAGLLSAIARLWSKRFIASSRRDRACLALTVWVVIGALVVMGRGTLGGRFHLMYLPALWMLAALWLGRLNKPMRVICLTSFGCSWALHFGLTTGWVHWREEQFDSSAAMITGLALSVVVAAILVATRRRLAPRYAIGGVAALGCVWAIMLSGPLQWASFSRFEPLATSSEMAAIDDYRSGKSDKPPAHGRTLRIDLANYYLAKGSQEPHALQQALEYAEAEAKSKPNDARAWAYVGEALSRLGAPADEIRSAWTRSLNLQPNERLQQRLDSLHP